MFEGDTIVALLRSKILWQDFVKPRLSPALKHDPRARDVFKVTQIEHRVENGTKRALMIVEISYGLEPVLKAFSEGFVAFMNKSDPQLPPYVVEVESP